MSKMLTATECLELAKAMDRKYQIYLDDRFFEIKNAPEGEGVLVTTILRNKDDSYHYPVSARMLHKEEALELRKAAAFLIDYIDSYFEDFLTTMESTYLPIDWVNMDYDGLAFQIKGQILNLKAEQMADQLLQEGRPYTGPNLLK